MVYGLYVRSPVLGLFGHRHRRNCFRQLDTSVEVSGLHDFYVRKKATSSEAPLASTAPRPAFRDDHDTPLLVGRDGGNIAVIWVSEKQKYFFDGGWTGQ